MQFTGSAVVAAVLVTLVGCSDQPARSAGHRVSSPSPATQRAAHAGSLTAAQRTLATSVARRYQRQVRGTFVGATGSLVSGRPYHRRPSNDIRESQLLVRLVWQAGASFLHSGLVVSDTPDGPRQALLYAVDLHSTAHLSCPAGATYRDVGAKPGETLLYGEWPDPAQS